MTTQEKTEEELEEIQRVDTYKEWQKQEGVPVIVDFAFDDLGAVELGPWPRKGGRGAKPMRPNAATSSAKQ